MDDLELLELAFVGGIAVGALFFGGLRWTLEHQFRSKNPLPWIVGSSLLRITTLMLGLFYITAGDWRPVSMGLLGFVIGRF